MEAKQKKRFFLSHKKSSALVISVAIHAVFIVVALTFVAVHVYIKPEQIFEVPDVKRPKMKLRKLQVPVKDEKKTQAPKLRQNIVAKPRLKDITIKMPEVVGVPGGTYGTGEGLGGLGFGFEMDLFGASGGTGNEFIGTFYDLKQTASGKLSEIGKLFSERSGETEPECIKTLSSIVSSSRILENRLDAYFKAPKLKYATVFMMPQMSADRAPKAFDVEDQVKPSYWVCHYKGQIAAPETGRYRFCGLGDDVLFVYVNRHLVLDACWHNKEGRMSSWESNDENNRKYPLDRDTTDKNDYLNYNSTLVIGDWVTLRKGQRVEMEILIGEMPGVSFTARLLVEQEGKQYRMVPYSGGQRPVLPVFKTTPIDEKIVSQMQINPNVATLEGPVFGVLINTKDAVNSSL